MAQSTTRDPQSELNFKEAQHRLKAQSIAAGSVRKRMSRTHSAEVLRLPTEAL